MLSKELGAGAGIDAELNQRQERGRARPTGRASLLL